MALLARTVSAGRVDPPAQQEPFPDDRRASRGARDAHPRLPHAAGAGRGGQIRSRDLFRRHRFRAYRRGVARWQGARTGLHEQHAGEILPVRQVRERPRDDSPHGGGGDRLFRRLHPQQRAGIRAHHRDDRRGDSLGVRQFDASLQAARGAESLRAHGERAAGGAVVVEAGRFALPALRRHLFDLYDPLYGGERRPPAASVAEGDQERLRIDLFRGVEGLRAVFAEPDRRGEDGRRDPGGVRHGAGRALLPHALGRGSVNQLLPHRRRDARRGGLQHRPRTGQAGRRRRPHAAFLAPLPAEGAANLHARTGAARYAERGATSGG